MIHERTNEWALHLIALGLNPVLLEKGTGSPRPQRADWAVYRAEDVADWPPDQPVGIRLGRQQLGLCLTVLAFTAESARIFPAWWRQVVMAINLPLVVVAHAGGYHAYCFTGPEYPSQLLAGEYVTAGGQPRLRPFIESLSGERLVRAVGSRSPGNRRRAKRSGQADSEGCTHDDRLSPSLQPYFLDGRTYADIPLLTIAEYEAVLAVSGCFDRRGETAVLPPIANCLDYARQVWGWAETVVRSGDSHFRGQGGLLITADGDRWYSFRDKRGGDLAELMAWHAALLEAESC